MYISLCTWFFFFDSGTSWDSFLYWLTSAVQDEPSLVSTCLYSMLLYLTIQCILWITSVGLLVLLSNYGREQSETSLSIQVSETWCVYMWKHNLKTGMQINSFTFSSFSTQCREIFRNLICTVFSPQGLTPSLASFSFLREIERVSLERRLLSHSSFVSLSR